jgi:uncharacterized protein YbjT (DUF2867 family)
VTTAVIGASGRIGGQIVRDVLARGDAVAALVRDPNKGRRVAGTATDTPTPSTPPTRSRRRRAQRSGGQG